MYREYPPENRLQDLIETYWVSDSIVDSRSTHRILPDGCVDIIFNFTSNDGTGRLLPYIPHLVGTMTSYLDIAYSPGTVQMLGIRFHPAGITAFTRIPVYELTNKTTELVLTETLFEKSFYDRLPELSTMQERIAHIENYLIDRLQYLFIPEKRIGDAIEHISNGNGLTSIKQIAEQVCLSERQFERRFKTAVGISPKMFSRITKFKHTVNFIQAHQDDSLLSIAFDCGYFDHSHLIKDFREFGGTLPSQLLLSKQH